MATAARRPRRWWRWPLYLLSSLLVLLALSLVVLRTSFAREQTRTRVNALLVALFGGRPQIDRIGKITLWGVEGVDAHIFDPRNRQVIRVQGLSSRASLLGLAWQMLAHSSEPVIELQSVHVDFADVTLREDEELGVTIASTFIPREKQTNGSPAVAGAPTPGPRLHIANITFGRIWAHGRVSGSPDLDADLTRLVASLRQSTKDGFGLDLDSVEVVTRAMPLGTDPSGIVRGAIAVPATGTGPLRLEGTLDGSAAGSPLALEVSWVGDYVHAAARLPKLPAAFVKRASGLDVAGDVALAADVDGPLPQLDFQAEIVATGARVRANGYAVVAQGRELSADVEATGIDLARISVGAPQSDLRLRASVLLFEADEGLFIGSHRLDVERGLLAQKVTPALWLSGKDRLDTEAGVRSTGKLRVTDPGVSIRGGYDVSLPTRGQDDVTLSVDAKLEDPQRLAAFGVHAAGTASVSLQLRPEARTLNGKASLSLGHLEHALVQARNVEVRAKVSGAIADPHLEGAATADLLSGRLHADLDYAPNSQQLDLFAANIDLPRLAHTLGVNIPIKQGKLALDAHVGRAARSGNYQLDGTADAELGPLGSLRVQAKEFQLPNGAPSLAQVSALRGELTASGKVELEALSKLLAEAGVPLERATGKATFELSAKHGRDDPRGLLLTAQLDTNGLRVIEKRAPSTTLTTTSDAIDAAPASVEGIDLHFAAHTWPSDGELVGTVILRDKVGTLADAEAEVQLGGLGLHQLTDVAALSGAPLKVRLEVPLRRLQSLPPLLRPDALRGRVAINAALEGSAREPVVKAEMTVESLRAIGSKQPLNVSAETSYAAAGGDARVVAEDARSHVQVANLSTSWRGDLRRMAQLGMDASGVTASAVAKLHEFPLEVVPALLDREIGGRVSGDVTLENWGRDARFDARLVSTSLKLGQTPIDELDVSGHTNQGALAAELRLRAGTGVSTASADVGMHWGSLPLPVLEHRGTVKIAAVGFKLETLNPLLTAYVSEIGGVLDAKTELDVTPTTTSLSGSAKLEKGFVQVPAIGQRFSDITARFAIANDEFKLERLDARGTTGRLSVKGAAHLDGFALRAADAQVTIPNHESIPITLEGADIGDAWGRVNASYSSPAQGEKKLDIDVPEFHLVSPEGDGYGLQSLDAAKDVRIGVRREDGAFADLPVQPLAPGGKSDGDAGEPAQPLRIQIKLGNNVTVERGRTAKAQLTGQLTVLTAAKTDVEGRIEVRGGKLDVSGKTFEIERGVITFEGDDPGNPTIAATARWDGPGYTVYAEYLGDVNNGRIKLHAEPPLTQDEIASLLLFGSPEGSAGGSADASSAALAVSVAGDTAAQGLTKVLDDFTKLDLSARVDTTTGTARPELVFQVSPRVSAKVTRAIGAPLAGESPDRTFLTLELRLRRAWALSALFGDHGASALDLIWRRRY